MPTAAKIIRLTVLLMVIFTLVPGTNPGYGQEKPRVDEAKYIKKYKPADRFFMRGKFFFLEGKYGAAEKQLKKGLKTMIGYAHPECHFYLARLYYKKGDFREALSQIKIAKADFESSADLLQKYRERKAVDLKKQKQDLDATYLEVSNSISSERACGSRWLGDIAEKAYEVEGKLNRISRAAGASASNGIRRLIGNTGRQSL
jgi:tetratricopeptide (TPR) repeat protein